MTGHRCKHIGYDEFDPPSWNSECAPSTADWIHTDDVSLCGTGGYPEVNGFAWPLGNDGATTRALLLPSILCGGTGVHACCLVPYLWPLQSIHEMRAEVYMIYLRYFFCLTSLRCFALSDVDLSAERAGILAMLGHRPHTRRRAGCSGNTDTGNPRDDTGARGRTHRRLVLDMKPTSGSVELACLSSSELVAAAIHAGLDRRHRRLSSLWEIKQPQLVRV